MPQTRTVTSLSVIEYPVAVGNWDSSRLPIDRIIIHTEDGFKAGTEATFNNSQAHVSAHYGINQDGTIDHYVDETNTAYHAGNYLVNQRSIGLEHEDFHQPNATRPDILYHASAKLVFDICQFYNLPIDRTHILKHSEVTQLGTSCPDSLDIERIVREAQAIALGVVPVIPPIATPINDQTTFDMGQGFGVMQMQAIRSRLHDQAQALADANSKLPSLSAKAQNFDTVADQFSLSAAQRIDPSGGKWIIDQIKQIQTAYLLRQSLSRQDQLDSYKNIASSIPSTPTQPETPPPVVASTPDSTVPVADPTANGSLQQSKLSWLQTEVNLGGVWSIFKLIFGGVGG